ncbi:hypothetical protein HYALB_00005951 [Hymenoscyphus albidus]|uniref:SAC3/GANP/THP3 conserved domain-containing protein n=1 Tax=Hymenoscyphus albidus TaxID=595503 RepID=A0A9N9LBY8_9HELO|nr:hypothetical protein HYALB_00005951 [Hymenoscyphus albidus]
MLLHGSSTRGARGHPQNRSRGRGRGSTSRGASSSNTSPTTDSTDQNPFENERRENAARRALRGQSSSAQNGRGGSLRGRDGKAQVNNTKQVRFADPPTDKKMNPFASAPVAAPRNPFDTAKKPVASPFGSAAASAVNPFATKQDAPANTFGAHNPFGAPTQATMTPNTSVFGAPSTTPNSTPPNNPFGAPSSISSPAANVFGKPMGTSSAGTTASNPFGKPSSTLFGSPSTKPANNPFEKPAGGVFGAAPVTSSTFGAKSNGFPSTDSKPTQNPPFNSFGAPTASPSIPAPSQNVTSAGFGTRFASPYTPKNAFNKPVTNGQTSKALFSNPPAQATPSASTNIDSSALAKEIYQTIRKDRITAPKWPTPSPGDPKFKPAIETYWKASKSYRSEVRVSLIKAGLLDDPDKPKKLSEAIDFKGICEEMCPDFEKATRIYERDYKSAETEIGPDGSSVVAPYKMVKALARSAAGQDAPLPMDVRSPGALRRTLDYLLNSVLGDDENNLPNVHHFLWDRTRAIRRDFVFQSSMDSAEMLDQVYCLERIARFHVISLHRMSKDGVSPAEEFSEQQEVEQLSKALLSLIHSYDDCKAQNITCENESEFRAYYALFNCRHPGMLQTVQDWGFKLFRESDEIQTALSLIEAIQNIWDARGPLTPQTPTDIAQNFYAKFFTILEDKQVSYTMACFAEIHFNSVRKSILKTILASYRKQRDQTKDWTLAKLNAFLRFDEEDDIIVFGEAYGLRFDHVDGEDVLSFESDEGIKDPFPPLKQAHSYKLVEHKRGNYSLPEAINNNVFDETLEEQATQEEEESLFVSNDKTETTAPMLPPIADTPIIGKQPPSFSSSPPTDPPKVDIATPSTSILNGIPSQKPFNGFFPPKPPVSPAGTVPEVPQTVVSKPSALYSNPLDKVQSPNVNGRTELTPSVSTLTIKSGNESHKSATTANISSSFTFPSTATDTPSTGTNSTPPVFGSNLPSAQLGSSPKAPILFGVPPASTIPPVSKPAINSSQIEGQRSFSAPNQTNKDLFPKVPAPAPLPAQVPASGAPYGSFQPNVPSIPNLTTNPSLGTLQATPNSSSEIKKRHKYDREAQLTGLTNWMVLGEHGLVDQFLSFTVENLLKGTVEVYLKEEAQRQSLEQEKSDRIEADAFRYRSLATRYFNRWRNGAQNLRMKRRGREARQARRAMAENLRASKTLQSTNIVQDFRASARSHRRESLESLLGATGVLDGVHDQNKQLQAIVRKEVKVNGTKRHRSNKAARPSSSSSHHKRGGSDNPLRRSILSDPTYLTGGSRIHLMDKYDIKDETRRQVSGVQTDYFRLKARGIATLSDGTPLATSVAHNMLHQKRSYDGPLNQVTTPPRSRVSSIARSVPSKIAMDQDFRLSIDGNEDIQALKRRAQAVMQNDERSQLKRSLHDDDDDALFERARRVREQMNEGMKWYREEREKESGSRSVS